MLSPGLIQKQAQSLVMTPQMRQAIEMLQLTQTDLAQYLRQIAERNPLLSLEETDTAPPAPDERDDFPDDDDPNRATAVPERPEIPDTRPDPRTELAREIRLSFPDPTAQAVALYLLHDLDEAGRLTTTPQRLAEALGVAVEDLEVVRVRLMQFEPVGMFAISLEECLAAQLRARNRLDPAMATLLRNLDLLAAREWRRLREKCALEQEDLLDMLAEIRALDPKPGFMPDMRSIAPEPDVIVRRSGSGYRISLNARLLPKVTLDTTLYERLRTRPDARETVTGYAAEASFILRALESRKISMLKIASGIVERQHGFIESGLGAMRPFTMRELASTTELHESTVSRIVNAKTMDTLRGVFAFRIFFPAPLATLDSNSPSATAIQHRIRTLIDAEGADILSDDALTEQLQAEGVAVQRRTVAKYREALNIPNSNRRRRLSRTS